MPQSLEDAVLSGELFSTDSGSRSPPRQHSPLLRAHDPSDISSDDDDDQESGNGDGQGKDEQDESRSSSPRPLINTADSPSRSIPNLPSNTQTKTGAKGVINDAHAARASSRAEQAERVARIQVDQARKAMVGLTVHEEDALRRAESEQRERGEGEGEGKKGNEGNGGRKEEEAWRREKREDEDARRAYREMRRAEIMRAKGENRVGAGGGGRGRGGNGEDGEDEMGRSKAGAVKEVGREGFVRAVERPGWVLVLIYEPDIPRCQALITSLLSLSLSLTLSLPRSGLTSSPPEPKIDMAVYRARARALRFSLLPFDGETGATSRHTTFSDTEQEEQEGQVGEDDEDDLTDIETDENGVLMGRPDPDVLPTLLAYRNGELQKTWVRVDWEVREDGVEGLLRREGILPKRISDDSADDE